MKIGRPIVSFASVSIFLACVSGFGVFEQSYVLIFLESLLLERFGWSWSVMLGSRIANQAKSVCDLISFRILRDVKIQV